MNDNDIKAKLVDAVKVAVAAYGVDGVSTRKIAEIAQVSDGNIYRFFRTKDELLFEAYSVGSGALISMIIHEIDQLHSNNMGLSLQDSARIIFMKIWNYLLDDKDMCRFHCLYYHSVSYENSARDFHTREIDSLVEHLNWLFFTKNDTSRCIQYILTIIYDCAKQVVDGIIPGTEDTANLIFNDMFALLYCMSNRWPFRTAKF